MGTTQTKNVSQRSLQWYPRGSVTYGRKGFVWRALTTDSWIVEFHFDGVADRWVEMSPFRLQSIVTRISRVVGIQIHIKNAQKSAAEIQR